MHILVGFCFHRRGARFPFRAAYNFWQIIGALYAIQTIWAIIFMLQTKIRFFGRMFGYRIFQLCCLKCCCHFNRSNSLQWIVCTHWTWNRFSGIIFQQSRIPHEITVCTASHSPNTQKQKKQLNEEKNEKPTNCCDKRNKIPNLNVLFGTIIMWAQIFSQKFYCVHWNR